MLKTYLQSATKYMTGKTHPIMKGPRPAPRSATNLDFTPASGGPRILSRILYGEGLMKGDEEEGDRMGESTSIRSIYSNPQRARTDQKPVRWKFRWLELELGSDRGTVIRGVL